MRLICPGCGLTASAEAWLNDAEARDLLLAVAKMPAPLPEAVLPYLGLFRPQQRALSWKKAARLLADLAQLTGSGHVQIQGQPARPCPPRIWAEAMGQMIERRERLSLPMPNHNYLRQVAWQLADQADSQAEKSRVAQERNGNMRSGGATQVVRGVNPLAKLMGFEE